MSRTKKDSRTTSPVTKYLSFRAGSGQFSYYDKSKVGDDKNVYLDSLEVILLDEKSSVSGYNEKTSSQVTSNLLNPYSVGKEPFSVRTKVDGSYQVVVKGIWKDIRAETKQYGGKFTANLFAIAKVDGVNWELVRLELSGAGIGAWLDFRDGKSDDDLYDMAIKFSKGGLCKRDKSKTVKVTKKEYDAILEKLRKNPLADKPVLFYTPLIETRPVTTDEAELAEEMDTKLQEYFDSITKEAVSNIEVVHEEVSTTVEADPIPTPVDVDEEEEEDDDLPF